MPILGMLVGAFIYTAIYPLLALYVIPLGQLGNLSVANALGISHWIVIVGLAIGAVFLFRFFERKNL